MPGKRKVLVIGTLLETGIGMVEWNVATRVELGALPLPTSASFSVVPQ